MQGVSAMSPKLLFAAGAVFLMALGLSGCGYRFSGEGTGPRPGMTSVAIPVFENATSEPGLGSILAGALRQEFLQRGSMRVVPMEETDFVFRGKITNIHTSGLAHRTFEETVVTRIYLTLDIRCHDRRSGEIIWQDSHLTYHQAYKQDADAMVSFQNRQDALKILARQMAVRIHDRFLNNF